MGYNSGFKGLNKLSYKKKQLNYDQAVQGRSHKAVTIYRTKPIRVEFKHSVPLSKKPSCCIPDTSVNKQMSAACSDRFSHKELIKVLCVCVCVCVRACARAFEMPSY